MATRTRKQMILRSQVTDKTKFFTTIETKKKKLSSKNKNPILIDDVFHLKNKSSTSNRSKSNVLNLDIPSFNSNSVNWVYEEFSNFINECFYDSPPPPSDTKPLLYQCKYDANGKVCENACFDQCGFTSGCIKHYGWEEYTHKYS